MPNKHMPATSRLMHRPLLIRALLVFLLLMQYATVTHAAAHHLFDTPLQADSVQCDGFHLQQSCGQPVSVTDTVVNAARTEPAIAPTLATPVRLSAAGFQPRAPPHIS